METSQKPEESPALIIFAFLAIYIIWGSTYLMNKIAVSELPPFMLAGVRFTMAGLLIFGIAKLTGKSLAITPKQIKNTTIAGLLFLTLGNGLAVWALQYIDSGFAALEIAAQPLVVILMMRLFQGKKIQAMSMIGVLLGMLGLYLLVGQDEIVLQEGSALGTLMIFICMLCWGYGSLFVGTADLPRNAFVNTGYQMVFGGLLLLIGGLVMGERMPLPGDWSPKVVLSMVLLILLGSIVAFTSFNYLLKVVSPEKVATSTYVNPVVAMFLGWYILNERITAQSIIAAVILLTGVYFINTRKKLPPISRMRRQ